MRIVNPRISKTLTSIDGFYSYANVFRSEESVITEIRCCEEEIEGADFCKIEIQNSIFERCTFHNCDFEKASFVDVVFQSCDLSNSRFVGAYFSRCQFISCKCLGVDMADTYINHAKFEHSKLRYTRFDRVKMTDVLFDHVDFTEASMAEAKLKRFESNKSMFVKNNLYNTLLVNVDFSNNEFVAPTLSSTAIELKGVIINEFQAAGLVSIWGIVIK